MQRVQIITRRSTGIAVTCFIAALVACGASTAANPKPSPTLSKALLRARDIPAVYGKKYVAATSGPVAGVCGSKLLGGITPVGQAGADFSQSVAGPFISETLSEVPSGQGGTDIAKEESALAHCHSWKQRNPDGGVGTYTLTRISFPSVGDQTLAYQMDVTAKGTTFSLPGQIDFVLIRKGDVFIDLLQGGIGRADPALLQTLARTAAQRLGSGSS